MLNGGENAESVSRAVSLLNRRLICCVLEHFARQHIWLKRCTFLEFGSGGRDEQIPGSDQDNGLLWTGDDPDPHDLEEAAQSVVVTLDGAGLPLCPGGVMFNSEKWRGNFTTWSDRLTSWLANPREKGPWQFGLILDFTPVFGPQEQALALREELWKYIRSRPLAIKILTSELMAYRLPLTFWGSFVLEKKGPCAGLLNIKSSILAHLTNAARILALKHDVAAIHTLDRVRSLALLRHIDQSLAARLEEAWELIQRHRLEAGSRKDTGNEPCEPNWIRPYQWEKDRIRALKRGIHAVQEFVSLVVAGAGY
jgi:CBS domain-containing protein